MKKVLSLFLALISVFVIISNVFAYDPEPSTQAVTQQSNDEITAAQNKQIDANKIIAAEKSYSEGLISKTTLNSVIASFNQKYNKNLSAIGMNSQISPMGVGSDTYAVIGIPCNAQQQTWYCGPASAYNIISGIGITKNPHDGRSLTQTNLANDLGAQTVGAPFAGSWAATMASWTNYFYVASWASSSGTITQWTSDIDTDIRVDVHDTSNTTGVVCDTHQTPSDTINRLVGYDSVTSDVWHYVAADGFDETNKIFHYADCNVYRSGAFGTHWVSQSIMAHVTWDRGIVW